MAETAVIIPEKIFFKIGEVCDIVDVQAHVLRYWETEFPTFSPQKNRSGQRTYRRRDVEIALQIKDLLYEDLYTIAGAKKRLQTDMRKSSKLKIVKPEPEIVIEKEPVKEESEQIKDEIQPSLIDTKSSNNSDVSFETKEDKRDALKSLASQLLDLREMLKSDQTAEAEKHISKY